MAAVNEFLDQEIEDRGLDLSAFPDLLPSQYEVEPLTGLEAPPPEEEFSAGEEFYSAFAESNPFGGELLDPLDRTDYPPVEGYDPFKDDITDRYAPSLFVEADSPQQTRQIIERVEFQRQMQRQDKGFGSVASVAGHLSGIVTNPAYVAAAFVPGGLVRVIAAEMAAEGVNETLRHYQQPERTAKQSAANIAIAGGAALVIGGAIKGYQAINRDRTVIAPRAEGPETTPELTPSGGLSANVAFPEPEELFDPVLVQNPGLVKFAGGTTASPAVDVAVNSYSEVAKRTMLDLVPVPTQFIPNRALSTSPVASIVKQTDGDTYMMYMGFKSEYTDFRKAGGKLKEDDFLEAVSDAMNALDEHTIPEVAKTASIFRNFDTKYFKDAIKEGMYGDNPPVQNLSHLQRYYLKPVIEAARSKFKAVIIRALLRREAERAVVKIEKDVFTVNPADVPQLQQMHGENITVLDTSTESVDGIADSIIDTILGVRAGSKETFADYADAEHIVPVAGSLHERTLAFIPYRELKPYIETNALSVMNITAHQMTRSLEMKKRFGDLNMEGRFAEIRKEYLEVKNTAPDKLQKKMAKQEKRDIEVATALRDQIYGVYKRPDMANNFVQAGRVLKVYTQTTFGQNIMTSSIPDIVGPALRHGFKPFYQGIKLMVNRDSKSYREFVNRLGIGVNMVTNARATALSGMEHQKAWEKTWMRRWANWTGLNYFSDWTQSMNAMSTSEMWISQIRRGPTKSEANKMLDRGIDAVKAQRIIRQIDQYGKQLNGTMLPESYLWHDKGAAEAFDAALRTEVASTTLIPDVGDAPLWTKTEMGSHFSMYTSFVTSAHNKFLISGMQRRDADMLVGVFAITLAGVLTVALKDTVRGKDITDKDVDKWFLDALDRAGITGWLFTPVKLGYSIGTGELPSTWQSKQSWERALRPPPLARGMDTGEIILKAMKGEEVSNKELNKAIPLFNMYHSGDVLRNLVLDVKE